MVLAAYPVCESNAYLGWHPLYFLLEKAKIDLTVTICIICNLCRPSAPISQCDR